MKETLTMQPPFKAALLNDTSYQNHHGCRLVISNLIESLAKIGVEVFVRSPAGSEWWSNKFFIENLNKCDLVIINGEGTLHHGRKKAENILKIAEYPFMKRTPIILINSIYQNNPSQWVRYLRNFKLIYVRDQWSKAELEKLGLSARYAPDLSLMKHARIKNTHNPEYVLFGDSVKISHSEDIIALYRKYSGKKKYIPIISSQTARSFQSNSLPSKMANIPHYCFHKIKSYLNMTLPGSVYCHSEYYNFLANSRLNITGRFHSVCMSISSRTPFVYFESNTHKIDALMNEIGLNMLRKKDPKTYRIPDDDFPFSEGELANIDKFLTQAENLFESMFQDIRNTIVT